VKDAHQKITMYLTMQLKTEIKFKQVKKM